MHDYRFTPLFVVCVSVLVRIGDIHNPCLRVLRCSQANARCQHSIHIYPSRFSCVVLLTLSASICVGS